MANGYANRFLFAKVRRSKKLADGGNLDDAQVLLLGERTAAALAGARTIGRVTMTKSASRAWRIAYDSFGDLTTGMVAEVPHGLRRK